MRTPRDLNIAVGNFFFKYRNALFPVLFLLAVGIGRPKVIADDPGTDRLLAGLGVLVTLTGQAVRLFTIGYEYIERGGKEGKVFASRLVQGDVYSLTRNPMYLGNALIATGITMVSGAPLLYVAVLPFFLFVYQAIVAAEEAYLRKRFGAEYDRYCASVPRWIPSVGRTISVLSGKPYDWRKAVRKELSTMAGLLTGLILLPVWRQIFLSGWSAAKDRLVHALVLEAILLAGYALLAYSKRQRWLFYQPE